MVYKSADDSAAAPAYTWDNDSNTGVYHTAEGQVAISSNGSNVAVFGMVGSSGTIFVNLVRATTIALLTLNSVNINASNNINGKYITATGNFAGPGGSITGLNANNIDSGTLDVERGGTGATTITGSGANVLSDAPTLSNPIIKGTLYANTIRMPTDSTSITFQDAGGKQVASIDSSGNITYTGKLISTMPKPSFHAVLSARSVAGNPDPQDDGQVTLNNRPTIVFFDKEESDTTDSYAVPYFVAPVSGMYRIYRYLKWGTHYPGNINAPPDDEREGYDKSMALLIDGAVVYTIGFDHRWDMEQTTDHYLNEGQKVWIIQTNNVRYSYAYDVAGSADYITRVGLHLEPGCTFKAYLL